MGTNDTPSTDPAARPHPKEPTDPLTIKVAAAMLGLSVEEWNKLPALPRIMTGRRAHNILQVFEVTPR